MDKKTIDDLMGDIEHVCSTFNDLIEARVEKVRLIDEEDKLKKIDAVIKSYTGEFEGLSKEFNEKYKCYEVVCEEYDKHLSLVINRPFNKIVEDRGGNWISRFIDNILMETGEEGCIMMPAHGKVDKFIAKHTRIIIYDMDGKGKSEAYNLLRIYMQNKEQTKTFQVVSA